MKSASILCHSRCVESQLRRCDLQGQCVAHRMSTGAPVAPVAPVILKHLVRCNKLLLGRTSTDILSICLTVPYRELFEERSWILD
jgi:hypothetical protein